MGAGYGQGYYWAEANGVVNWRTTDPKEHFLAHH